MGWLAAGAAVLCTLPASGHDINLFQLAEPAIALLAAWGVMGLAERGRPLPVAAAVVLLIGSVVFVIAKDRSFLGRSNAGDVREIVTLIEGRSGPGESVLAPGCFALEAGRQVSHRFYDQFLWEEKYRRGDREAVAMFEGLRQDINRRALPVIVFEDDRGSLSTLGGALDENYRAYFRSSNWPDVTLWIPARVPVQTP